MKLENKNKTIQTMMGSLKKVWKTKKNINNIMMGFHSWKNKGKRREGAGVKGIQREITQL
jgi:hypothetical protein